MPETEAITVRAGSKLTLSCGDCCTDCLIEHEPSASRNCPQDVPEKTIRFCPYCGSEDVEAFFMSHFTE